MIRSMEIPETVKACKVSIIIPVYDVEQYIHECIDSVLAQTFTDFELILVDDCSPDSCPKICDEYAKRDIRVKVIHKPKNEGLPQARKTGFENSSGGYIQFIDSDDWIEKNMLEKMYLMALSEGYDMVCCDWYQNGVTSIISYEKMPVLSDDFIANIKTAVLGRNAGCVVWNKLVKREVYGKIHFPQLSNGEDSYITTQTLFFSKKIGYVNIALYHYRYNLFSLANHPKLARKRYLERLENYMQICGFLRKTHGGDLRLFEPELTAQMKRIESKNPRRIKNIAKKVMRTVIPSDIRKRIKRIFGK